MAEEIEYVIEHTAGRLFNWSELWRYRELFYFFTWRDIKIRYKQALLGVIWALLQPLLMMFIFTFFFGQRLQISSGNLQYPVFVFSGLLIWNIFSNGLTNAANSMINNASIIKKIYFPRLIIPASSILVALFDFLMASSLFAGILIYYGQRVSLAAIWCWPLSIMACIVATLGPGCWLAALNVKYRDFRYVIPFLVQVLFFLSPIIYPVSFSSYPLIKSILVLSPIYAVIELFRFPLTGVLPEWTYIAISLGSSIILLCVGLFYFRKAENFFADFA